MLEIACPRCGTRMPYAPAMAGREVFCLGCGSHYLISEFGTPVSRNDPSEMDQAATPRQPSDPKPQSTGPSSRPDAD